ncbi:MAG: hypothetical protein M3Z24_12330 [Chloroflexota bacterium]|nr:hypothetical protein [Chloroflexota bacterium]
MPFVLWTIMSLIGYAAGLAIIIKVTPLLLSRAYDEGLFMAIAAADVVGGLLLFGAVAITFGVFAGNFPIRVLDFLLLVGILLIGLRMAMRSFRSSFRIPIHRVSHIAAGSYCLFLSLAAISYIVLLFIPSR